MELASNRQDQRLWAQDDEEAYQKFRPWMEKRLDLEQAEYKLRAAKKKAEEDKKVEGGSVEQAGETQMNVDCESNLKKRRQCTDWHKSRRRRGLSASRAGRNRRSCCSRGVKCGTVEGRTAGGVELSGAGCCIRRWKGHGNAFHGAVLW